MRTPWSDRRVAETVLAIAPRVVQRGGEPKRLARRSLADYFPAAALQATRPRQPLGLFERGFKDRSRATVEQLVDSSVGAALGLIDGVAFKTAYQDYVHGVPVRHDFWWPLTLEIWLRKYWS